MNIKNALWVLTFTWVKPLLYQKMYFSPVSIVFWRSYWLWVNFWRKEKRRQVLYLLNFMLPYVEFLFVLPFNSQRNKNRFLKLEFKKVVHTTYYIHMKARHFFWFFLPIMQCRWMGAFPIRLIKSIAATITIKDIWVVCRFQ